MGALAFVLWVQSSNSGNGFSFGEIEFFFEPVIVQEFLWHWGTPFLVSIPFYKNLDTLPASYVGFLVFMISYFCALKQIALLNARCGKKLKPGFARVDTKE